MEKKTNWHILYTKPRSEKKVAEMLGRKQIEHYCPMNKVSRSWFGKTKTDEQPLFQSYVFVRTDKETIASIKSLDAVINFVYWLGQPAIVQDSDIASIKAFVPSHRDIQLQRMSLKVSDHAVQPVGNLLASDNNSLPYQASFDKVLLPSLGYSLMAEACEAAAHDIITGSGLKNPNLHLKPNYNGIYR